MTNLFSEFPAHIDAELSTILLDASHIRIERIVSHGHASSPDYWYDQEEAEWVIVLKGAARLRFDSDPQPVEMMPGDFVNIPAHRRHRVEWTTPDEPTIWLAVYYGDQQ